MIAEDKTTMRQKLKQARRHCGSLLLKLLKYLAYGAGAIAVILLIAFAVMQFYIFPNINQYKSKIETIASQGIGASVSIADIQAGWDGIYPEVKLTQVSLRNADSQGLTLPEVSAAISWKSLFVWQIRFAELKLIQPELMIHRAANGQLMVGSIPVSTESGDGDGLAWLLNQRHIEIQQGTIHWLDDVRQAPLLTLNAVNLSLHNRLGRYHLQLNAAPDLPQVSPVSMDVRFGRSWRSLLSKEDAYHDLTQWYSHIHVDVPQIDLSAWKQYIDLPVNVEQGTGEIHANVEIDRAKVTAFSAKLNVEDVKLQWNQQLAPLDLKVFRGEISASETYTGYFKNSFLGIGKLGHAVELKNVYVELAQGDTLASDYMTERYWPETAKNPEKTELQFASLNLKTVALLAKSLPLTRSQQQILQDLQPSGELSHFSVGWEGSYPDVSRYELKGDFNHLSIAALPFRPAVAKTKTQPAIAVRMAVPGVQNMSGSIDAKDTGGKLLISSDNAVIQVGKYIPDDKLAFNRFEFNSDWVMKPDNHVDINIHRFDFKLDQITGSISGTQKIAILDPQSSVVDMQGKFTGLDVKDMRHYLPNDMDKDVHAWLLGALVKGGVPEVSVTMKGKLGDFPYTQQQGVFKVEGKISQATMNYYPGHLLPESTLPDWPLLNRADGEFAINGGQLSISVHDADTNGLKVPKVKAVIDDLTSFSTTLHIDGYAEGAMQNMVSYVADSPVNVWLDGFTKDTEATGDGKVHLQFQMPLNDPEATKVQGTVTFLKNNVRLFTDFPYVNNTTGELHFNEKGFSLKQIQGQLFGQPLTVEGGTLEDGATSVAIRGSVEANGLRHQWGESVFKPVLNQINGKADFTAQVHHHHGMTEVSVNSSLQGLASQLPAPFTKKTESVLPVTFVLQDVPSQDPLLRQDKITLKLGNIVDVLYRRQKVVDDDNWHVISGGIGVYHAAPQPASGVTIHSEMPSIDMDPWLNYRSASDNHLTVSEQLAADQSYSQYSPTTIIIQTPELHINQRTITHVALTATRDQGMWRSNINSDQIEGFLSWQEPQDSKDLGHVVARLKRLIIPKSEAAYIEKASESGRYTKENIPTLDIEAEYFQLFDHQLGKLVLKASTHDTAEGQDWIIHQLQLNNEDGHFQAQGKWQLTGNQSHTHLTYALDVADAGKLLTRLDFGKMIAGGKGRLDGDVNWTGSPFSPDIPSMKGSMTLAVENGQFLKIDPGAARLLGVLSLQSLPRRLILDFKDVFSSGLAFDKVSGNAVIDNGVLSTDSLHIHNVSVDVNLKGDVDLDRETQRLEVTVIPDINFGAASVAMIAVNPLVGLSTFFTQWALQGSIKKSLTYMYDVSGSWTDPVVVKREDPESEDKK